MTIRAPFAGTIVTRTAEPGEIVSPGTPIVTLVDLAIYLRGYVPEGRIGLVKAGQSARVYLDSSPDEPVEAVVSRIDPQATFTPENTYFREDRVKQVVGVKLQLKGAIGFAKPGMPADGEIWFRSSWPTAAAARAIRPRDGGRTSRRRRHAAGHSRRCTSRSDTDSVEAVPVSFEIARAKIFGLIGPDGAGKTSTFQVLAGVMDATRRPARGVRPTRA